MELKNSKTKETQSFPVFKDSPATKSYKEKSYGQIEPDDEDCQTSSELLAVGTWSLYKELLKAKEKENEEKNFNVLYSLKKMGSNLLSSLDKKLSSFHLKRKNDSAK